MSAIAGRRTTLRPQRTNRLYWAVADTWVLAKRNLMQIPRIPELLDFIHLGEK